MCIIYGMLLWLMVAILGHFPLAASAADQRPRPALHVTLPRAKKSLDWTPAAIGFVEQRDIQLGRQQLSLDESLARIPGIFAQNRTNFAQDLRLSIRGFGARSTFGIRGIMILVDGIPATLPDGQSQVDGIDLGIMERIEVLRGPASSLYGNASGGVLSLQTETGPQQPELSSRFAFGDFGYRKTQLKLGGPTPAGNYLINISRLELKGYREHSRTELRQASGKFNFAWNSSSQVTTLVRLMDSPIAEDPGALNRSDAGLNPRQAAARNIQFDAGERVREGSLGIRVRKELSGERILHSNLHTTYRNFANKLPFLGGGIVRFDRLHFGGGVRLINPSQTFGRPGRLTIGLDTGHQSDDRRRFDNLDGSSGPEAFHQLERVTSLGAYLREEWKFSENWELTLGLRYDRVRFDIVDRFLSDGDDSGARTLDAASPQLALAYAPDPRWNLYANLSTSFETPTTTEFANPTGGGGLNQNLGPQRATNYEAGIKGGVPKLFRYELTVFTIRVKGELTPFQLPASPGRTFFQNAGRSARTGVELGFQLGPLSGWTLSTNYTHSNFFFREFQTTTGIFNGNRIPGIPIRSAYGEIAYSHTSGFYSAWEARHTGPLFADNANTERVAPATVCNLRFGIVRRFGRWEISPFVGLLNVFGTRTNANVRINAFANRFYEPAAGFNYYSGLSITMRFTPSTKSP